MEYDTALSALIRSTQNQTNNRVESNPPTSFRCIVTCTTNHNIRAALSNAMACVQNLSSQDLLVMPYKSTSDVRSFLRPQRLHLRCPIPAPFSFPGIIEDECGHERAQQSAPDEDVEFRQVRRGPPI